MSFLDNKSCIEINKIVNEQVRLYSYFSDSEEVRESDIIKVQALEDSISVPQIDIEQSIKALCLSRESKSSAVCSQFYESRYLPYPIIISAIKLLHGTENAYYLVIGSKEQWKTVLKGAYQHGKLANHPLSKYYDFIDILNVKTNKGKFQRRSYKTVRWVLSGFSNSDLWEKLRDVALIVVDMVTVNTSELDETDIEVILSYSRKNKIPIVFFVKNYADRVSKYLKNNGVEMIVPSIALPKPTNLSAPQVHSYHIKNEELKAFLTYYNLRYHKINKNGLKKSIEIIVVDNNKIFSKFFHKYLELSSSLNQRDLNSNGRRARYLSRNLYGSIMEFTGNVSTTNGYRFEWIKHPIGVNRTRFYETIWKLSDQSQILAKEMIDEVDLIMKNFESKNTPKGESLLKLLKGSRDHNKKVVLLAEQSDLDNFLKNSFPERASFIEEFLVSSEQLENASASDHMILLSTVDWKNKTILLTSCCSSIIILNYSEEVNISRKTIEDIKKFYSGERFSSGTTEIEPKYETIEIKVTGAVNQSINGETEFRDETERDLISQLKFNETEDFFEDDLEEEMDEDILNPNLKSENQNTYELVKWVVSIENREVIVPSNRKIVLVKDNKTYTVKISKLSPGDRILITKNFNPKSLSEFVWEIMEKKFGIKRKTHPGNEWREKLKEYMNQNPEISYAQVFEKLKEVNDIGIKTPVAIYLWLESYDLIGPQDFITLKAIAKLVNSENRLKEWWEGIQYIRMRHRRMIHHLWKVVKYSAMELEERNAEDYVIDHVLGIKISEISKLVRFATVTGTPKKA